MILRTSMGLQLQLLNLLNDQNIHNVAKIKKAIAKKYDITSRERKKLSKNKRPILGTRIIGALYQLRKKGYIINKKRANYKITKSGLNRLEHI